MDPCCEPDCDWRTRGDAWVFACGKSKSAGTLWRSCSCRARRRLRLLRDEEGRLGHCARWDALREFKKRCRSCQVPRQEKQAFVQDRRCADLAEILRSVSSRSQKCHRCVSARPATIWCLSVRSRGRLSAGPREEPTMWRWMEHLALRTRADPGSSSPIHRAATARWYLGAAARLLAGRSSRSAARASHFPNWLALLEDQAPTSNRRPAEPDRNLLGHVSLAQARC